MDLVALVVLVILTMYLWPTRPAVPAPSPYTFVVKTDWKIERIVISDTRIDDFLDRLTYRVLLRIRPPTAQEVTAEGPAKRPACFSVHGLDYGRCLEQTATVSVEVPIDSLDCPDLPNCYVLVGEEPVPADLKVVPNRLDGLHFAALYGVVQSRLNPEDSGVQSIAITAPAVQSLIRLRSNGLTTVVSGPHFEGPAIGTPVYLTSRVVLTPDTEWSDPSGPQIQDEGLLWDYRVDLAPPSARGVRSEVQAIDQARTFAAGIVAGIAGALVVSLAQRVFRRRTSSRR